MNDVDFETSIVTARKDYDCNAWEWLEPSLSDLRGELSFSDLRAIARFKRDGFKILKGQKYIVGTGIFEGNFYRSRDNINIDSISRKHDVYYF